MRLTASNRWTCRLAESRTLYRGVCACYEESPRRLRTSAQSTDKGGALERIELKEGLAISHERTEEMLALDEALDKLSENNPRQAKVVELRYFGGLTVDQVASVLVIAPRSVKRDWALARIWLFNELHPPRN
jgi:RNA polymerase sigma factor (TIGR02999 family)